jgi:hypothetical protein
MRTDGAAHFFGHRHSHQDLWRFVGRHGANQRSTFVANQISVVSTFDHHETAATIITVRNDGEFIVIQTGQPMHSFS